MGVGRLLQNLKRVICVQEVPAFRDFWYQKGITKFGDHEF
jgi:hypothetical protein